LKAYPNVDSLSSTKEVIPDNGQKVGNLDKTLDTSPSIKDYTGPFFSSNTALSLTSAAGSKSKLS
jgi:hypothetical protein